MIDNLRRMKHKRYIFNFINKFYRNSPYYNLNYILIFTAFLISPTLMHVKVIGLFSVSDILSIAVSAILFALGVNRRHFILFKGARLFVYQTCIFLLGIGFIIIFNQGAGYFNLLESIESFFHLIIYVVLAIFIYQAINVLDFNDFCEIIFLVAVLNSIYGASRLVFMYTGLLTPGGVDQFLRYGESMSQYVIRGLFSEPSYFATFQSLLVAFLLFHGLYSKYKLWLFFIFITIVLSLSIAGLAFLFLISITFFLFYQKKLKEKIMSVMFIGAGAAFVFSSAIYFRRISAVINLSDSSAMKRLVGSWAGAANLDSLLQILFGIGLGNYSNFVEYKLGPGLTFLSMTLNPPNSWNVIAIVFTSGGLLATFLLFAALFKIFNRNKYFGIFIVASFFVHGSFISPMFWLSIVMLAVSRKIPAYSRTVLRRDPSNFIPDTS